MSRILFAVAALAAAISAPTAASARPAGARIVKHSDLDLSAAAGRARLDQRIGAAVRAVCGSATPGDLAAVRAVEDCRAATLADVSRPVVVIAAR